MQGLVSFLVANVRLRLHLAYMRARTTVCGPRGDRAVMFQLLQYGGRLSASRPQVSRVVVKQRSDSGTHRRYVNGFEGNQARAGHAARRALAYG